MPDDGAKILTEQREPTAANGALGGAPSNADRAGSYNIQAFVVPLIVVGVLLVVAIALVRRLRRRQS